MFETLDIMISIGVLYLILSMVLKYLMSMIKRLLKLKANVVAEEMKTFIGENTSKYLIPYLEKNAKHLNFLEGTRGKVGFKKGGNALRQLNKDQLKEVVVKLKEFFESTSVNEIQNSLGVETNEGIINEIKVHLDTLTGRIEKMYDNTMEKISEIYESRARYFTLILGLLVVVSINADFFDIYSSISKSPVAREKLVAKAETINFQVSKIATKIISKEEEEFSKNEIQEVKDDIEDLAKNFDEAGLQFGWTNDKFLQVFEGLGSFFNKLLGLFISGLLISFGAPFWHEFLSSFVGIRKRLRGKEERKVNTTSTHDGSTTWLPR